MKAPLARLLRLPPAPAPPPGAAGETAVFQSSPRYLLHRRLGWGLSQAGTAVGLLLSFLLLRGFEPQVAHWLSRLLNRGRLEGLIQVAAGWGLRLEPIEILNILETFALLGFLGQFVISGILLKLDWEQRWYLLSDTCLRIREGLFRVREQTMTIANIQNMKVRQGPIQRLFGIADLEVHTAGGGAKAPSSETSDTSTPLRSGRLVGLGDAAGVRDRIRERLAVFRDAGLGDPDDRSANPEPASGDRPGLAMAIDRLLAESRALRRSLEPPSA